MELIDEIHSMPQNSAIAVMIALMPLRGRSFLNYPELIGAVRLECHKHPNMFPGNSGPAKMICRAVELNWIRQSEADGPLYVSIQ